MAADTERDPDDGMGLDQYWRRRAVALGGVLGAVGLMAWACTSGGGDGEKKQPVRNAAAVATAGASTSPAVPTAMPTVTVTTTAKVTATPKVERKDGDACETGDVVVNMALIRDTYARGESPQFQMTVVNTGERACTYDVGSKSIDIRITSGADRIWAASSCEQGSGSSIQMLRRGVPYVNTVTWDRMRATDKCRGKRDKAGPGTYVASVKADKLKVKKQIFYLR